MSASTDARQRRQQPTVQMTLDLSDLKMLARSLKRVRVKLENDLAKSTFVPEPGHANVAERSLVRARHLETRVVQQLHALQTARPV